MTVVVQSSDQRRPIVGPADGSWLNAYWYIFISIFSSENTGNPLESAAVSRDPERSGHRTHEPLQRPVRGLYATQTCISDHESDSLYDGTTDPRAGRSRGARAARAGRARLARLLGQPQPLPAARWVGSRPGLPRALPGRPLPRAQGGDRPDLRSLRRRGHGRERLDRGDPGLLPRCARPRRPGLHRPPDLRRISGCGGARRGARDERGRRGCCPLPLQPEQPDGRRSSRGPRSRTPSPRRRRRPDSSSTRPSSSSPTRRPR